MAGNSEFIKTAFSSGLIQIWCSCKYLWQQDGVRVCVCLCVLPACVSLSAVPQEAAPQLHRLQTEETAQKAKTFSNTSRGRKVMFHVNQIDSLCFFGCVSSSDCSTSGSFVENRTTNTTTHSTQHLSGSSATHPECVKSLIWTPDEKQHTHTDSYLS